MFLFSFFKCIKLENIFISFIAFRFFILKTNKFYSTLEHLSNKNVKVWKLISFFVINFHTRKCKCEKIGLDFKGSEKSSNQILSNFQIWDPKSDVKNNAKRFAFKGYFVKGQLFEEFHKKYILGIFLHFFQLPHIFRRLKNNSRKENKTTVKCLKKRSKASSKQQPQLQKMPLMTNRFLRSSKLSQIISGRVSLKI